MNYDWRIISPEIAILLTAFVLLIADLFIHKARNTILTAISFVGVIGAMLLTFGNFQSLGLGFGNIIINDHLTFYFRIIFCLGTLLTVFVSSNYIKREMKGLGEYYVLIFISTFGMMVMASSTDLITIFLGLEVMSIPLYVLAGINRDRPRSREASMKYFLMGAFSTGFLLYGIALMFGAYGSTNLIEIAERLKFGANYSQVLSSAGLAFILIGLGFKAAIAPFHMWVPDVYEGSIAPVTAFMSSGPKAAAFAALFRIFSLFSPVISDKFTTVLWILAIVTMTWGNILAISQKNIKRMLAYSSIAHAGYIMIALVAGGEAGLSAGVFYLLAYTVMNIGAFAIIVLFAGKGEKQENIKDYAGFGLKYPFAGVAMSIFMLSLAGIPSTAGFMGKYRIFAAAINSGYIWLVVIAVMNSLVSVWYYLGVIVTMYMVPESEPKSEYVLSTTLMVAILIALFGTIQLGLFPNSWLELANRAGASLNWLR
ncbi:MAG TPA: NADH-quinone oxidoreductase subunit N [candidate division Zixibacteria bacterium]|nr:NADH-quinone oxidoreductase subunit N [candidate division Zixibacteria bacterium]